METKQLYKVRTSRDRISVDISDEKSPQIKIQNLDSSWLRNFYFESEKSAIKYMSDYMKNTFKPSSSQTSKNLKADPKIVKSVWSGENSNGNCYRIRWLNSKVKFIVEPITIFIGKD